MCLPGSGRAHWDRISTLQRTRVEVEVGVGLRVGVEWSWPVGVGLGSSWAVGVGLELRGGCVRFGSMFSFSLVSVGEGSITHHFLTSL